MLTVIPYLEVNDLVDFRSNMNIWYTRATHLANSFIPYLVNNGFPVYMLNPHVLNSIIIWFTWLEISRDITLPVYIIESSYSKSFTY